MNGFSEFVDYGFDPIGKNSKKEDKHDTPMPSHHLEYIISSLRKIGVGTKIAKKEDFHTNVTWGTGSGSLKVVITPFGGMRAVIRKQVPDLEGVPTWLCIKVYQIEDYDNPDVAILQITKDLRQADKEGLPAPGEFKNLEQFVTKLTKDINYYSRQSVLMFEGIRAVKPEYDYIIKYSLTGTGLQKGQRRINQFQVEVKMDPKSGFLAVAGNEIGDNIASWSWQIEPSDFYEKFSPNQNKEEISRAVVESVGSVY
jgi:hypothetical protein